MPRTKTQNRNHKVQCPQCGHSCRDDDLHRHTLTKHKQSQKKLQ